MTSLIIGLLTIVLVITSLVLILLVLIQLPKKEAGAGLAFGGGASDALFGAGQGNVLTRVTKYATALFLILALTLSILQNHKAKGRGSRVLSELERKASATAVTPATASPTNLVLPPLQSAATGAPALKLMTTNPASAAVPTNTKTQPPAEAVPKP